MRIGLVCFLVASMAGCMAPAPTSNLSVHLADAWWVDVEGTVTVMEAGHGHQAAGCSSSGPGYPSSQSAAPGSCTRSCTRTSVEYGTDYVFNEGAQRFEMYRDPMVLLVTNRAYMPSYPCDGGYPGVPFSVLRIGESRLEWNPGQPGAGSAIPFEVRGESLWIEGRNVTTGDHGRIDQATNRTSANGIVHLVTARLEWTVKGRFPVYGPAPDASAQAEGPAVPAPVAPDRPVWVIDFVGDVQRSGPSPTHAATCSVDHAPLWASDDDVIHSSMTDLTVVAFQHVTIENEDRPAGSCGRPVSSFLRGRGELVTDAGVPGLSMVFRWDGSNLTLGDQVLRDGSVGSIEVDHIVQADGGFHHYVGSLRYEVEGAFSVQAT